MSLVVDHFSSSSWSSPDCHFDEFFSGIIFFRTKGAQKINFEQFCQALKEVAPKRFPSKSKDEAQASIFKLVENKTPGTTGVTVSEYADHYLAFRKFVIDIAVSPFRFRKLQTRIMSTA